MLSEYLKRSWKEFLFVAILISLAAAFNASQDTIEYHYNNSIFKNLPEYFYHDWTRVYEKDPDGNLIQPLTRKTWDLGFTKIKIHPMFFDGWHLFKTLWIGMFILVISWKKGNQLYFNLIRFIFFAAVWNLVFNLFFDHLLIL